MTISTQQASAMAWFECKSLESVSAIDGIPLLAATVARIAAAIDGAGFTTEYRVPAVPGTPRDKWDRIRDAAGQGIGGTYGGVALPTVAVLWEVDANGALVKGDPPFPVALDWITAPGVATQGPFRPTADSKLGTTRLFKLFVPANLGASMPAAFTSSITRTGLPKEAATVQPVSRLALSIGIALVALLAFCWAAGCMGWTGKQLAIGIRLLEDQRVADLGALAARSKKLPIDASVVDRAACVDGMALTVAPVAPASAPVASTSAAASDKGAKPLDAASKIACMQWWAVAMDVARGGHVADDSALLAAAAVSIDERQRTATDTLAKATQYAACVDGVATKLDAALAPAPVASAVVDAKALSKTCVGADLLASLSATEADTKKIKDAQADVKKAADAASASVSSAASTVQAVAQSASAAQAATVAPRTGAPDQTGLIFESTLFGAFAPGNVPGKGTPEPIAQASTACLIVPLAIMMVAVLALVVAAGLGVTGFFWGTFISDKNRISLARCQVAAWSILVLPAIVGFACFNAGAGVQFDTATLTAVFPSVPGSIWAALGLSIGSALLSPVLLASKDSATPALQVLKGATATVNDNVAGFSDAASLSAKENRSQASFSDLFLGEEKNNDTQVDISRLQMLVITVGLVLTYGQMIFALAGEVTFAGIAQSAITNKALFDALPAGGATFATMLAISHAAYIVTKAASTSNPPTNASTAT